MGFLRTVLFSVLGIKPKKKNVPTWHIKKIKKKKNLGYDTCAALKEREREMSER